MSLICFSQKPSSTPNYQHNSTEVHRGFCSEIWNWANPPGFVFLCGFRIGLEVRAGLGNTFDFLCSLHRFVDVLVLLRWFSTWFEIIRLTRVYPGKGLVTWSRGDYHNITEGLVAQSRWFKPQVFWVICCRLGSGFIPTCELPLPSGFPVRMKSAGV